MNALGAACPLTVLESRLRVLAGLPVHRDGAVEHYLVAPVHPAGITPNVRVLIYAVVVIAIVLPYGRMLRAHSRQRRAFSLAAAEGEATPLRVCQPLR